MGVALGQMGNANISRAKIVFRSAQPNDIGSDASGETFRAPGHEQLHDKVVM